METLTKYFNLLSYRTLAELRSEGTRTYAGYLWWIFEPLMSLAIYFVAFNYIFHNSIKNFTVFLFCGIVIFRFFSSTVTRSAESIQSGQGLMQLVYIHKSIFPLSVVMVNFVKFLITLLFFLVVCWFFGIFPSWSYLALPALILLQLLMTAGISMICATISSFTPDFNLILSTIMQLLIFLSGIFYDIKKLSPSMQGLVRMNPIAAMVEQYRAILLHGQWPEIRPLIPVLLESVIFIFIGWFFINKFNRYFPKIS